MDELIIQGQAPEWFAGEIVFQPNTKYLGKPKAHKDDKGGLWSKTGILGVVRD